jgi:hypothetical protein
MLSREIRSAKNGRGRSAWAEGATSARLLAWGLALFATGVAAIVADWRSDFRLIYPTLVGLWTTLVGLGCLAWATAQLLGDSAGVRRVARGRDASVETGSSGSDGRLRPPSGVTSVARRNAGAHSK